MQALNFWISSRNLQKLLSLWKDTKWRKLVLIFRLNNKGLCLNHGTAENISKDERKGEERHNTQIIDLHGIKKILKISELMKHKIISLLCSWFSSASYKRAIVGEESIPLAVSPEWLCKIVLKGLLTSFWQSPKGLKAASCCNISGCHQTWIWVV